MFLTDLKRPVERLPEVGLDYAESALRGRFDKIQRSAIDAMQQIILNQQDMPGVAATTTAMDFRDLTRLTHFLGIRHFRGPFINAQQNTVSAGMVEKHPPDQPHGLLVAVVNRQIAATAMIVASALLGPIVR